MKNILIFEIILFGFGFMIAAINSYHESKIEYGKKIMKFTLVLMMVTILCGMIFNK